jgi:Flp pilus assembly pilin Flp
MKNLVLRFLDHDSGATAIEYGLMHTRCTIRLLGAARRARLWSSATSPC